MKRILITGASGFIGGHLIKKLVEELCEITIVSKDGFDNIYETLHKSNDNVQITIAEVDLQDEFEISRIMNIQKPEIIYHLAAHSTPSDNEDQNQILYDNIIGTNNLLKNCPKGSHFIFTSSIVVYGDNCCPATDEKQPLTPTSLYGATKVAGEALINVYTEQQKITSACLRLCAVVGTNMTHGLILDVISKLKLKSKELRLIGDEPGTCKPYLHVDDAVQALILAQNLRETYNVLTCYPITVLDVAETIMKTINIHKPITWTGKQLSWKGDNLYLSADNQKILDAGWKPRFLLSNSAIRTTIKEIMLL